MYKEQVLWTGSFLKEGNNLLSWQYFFQRKKRAKLLEQRAQKDMPGQNPDRSNLSAENPYSGDESPLMGIFDAPCEPGTFAPDDGDLYYGRLRDEEIAYLTPLINGKSLPQPLVINKMTYQIGRPGMPSTTLSECDNDALPFPAEQFNQVSRHHCQITYARQAGTFSLTDCGSTNGTFLTHRRLSPYHPVEIQDGDIITLAACRLLFTRQLPAEKLFKAKLAEGGV